MNRLEARFAADLDALDRRLLRRRRMVRTDGTASEIEVDGCRLVNFASNDYLGLAGDPRIARALAAGAQRWGVGAGAAHLLGGHTGAHAEFEDALADYLGRDAALLFSTGYMANLGVVTALAGRGDTVVGDRLNHASLIDAAILSRARLVRYPHRDPAAAAERVRTAKGRIVLATEGVFSMDGDVAPLQPLARLAEEAGATLVVDDAHGFGVLGGGRGTTTHFGLSADRVPVLVVTFGKALGVFGAAVVGTRALIETLVNRARTYIYTTALPPAVASALTAALGVMCEEDWRGRKLIENIARFRARLQSAGVALGDSVTPIQPVLLGDVRRALAAAQALAARGYYVPAIRPPTVPGHAARLRVSLSAAQDPAQVEELADAIAQVLAGLD